MCFIFEGLGRREVGLNPNSAGELMKARGKVQFSCFWDSRGSTMKQETYEWHRVTGAWHNGLNHVHEHSQGKKDGDACKKITHQKKSESSEVYHFQSMK